MNDYMKYGNLGSGTEDSSISGIPLTDRDKQADIKKTLADLDKAKEVCLEQLDDKHPAAKGAKHDQDKIRYNLIPPRAHRELGCVMTFGAKKYTEDGWREVDNLKDRYLSAALRHIEAYRMNEMFDSESSLHHLSHAVACLSFIAEVDLQ